MRKRAIGRGWLAWVAVLGLSCWAGAAQPILDFTLRSSSDPDFLSPRQALRRQKLLDLGADPRQGQRPTLDSILQRRFADAANWDFLAEARQVSMMEIDWQGGLVKLIRHPESHLFRTNSAENVIGIRFDERRDFADSSVVIEVVDLGNWMDYWVAVGRNRRWENSVTSAQGQEDSGNQALNFRIPIKIPRSLERIIGRGDATNIRISGQESISIGGESTVRNDFQANEIRQSQSLFPSLEMQQRLRVDMNGTVGEKIQVRVTHNSEAGLGQKSTEVKMEFVGDEDDIVRGIRAGDIDVTLPGSGLLGVGASKGGLFGIRVEGAVGPMAYTLFTAKEQSQSNNRSFNSSGGTPTPFSIQSTDYVRGRFFRLLAAESYYFDAATEPRMVEIVTDDSATEVIARGWRIDQGSIELYVSATGLQGEETVGFARAYIDSVGIGWQDAERTLDPLATLPADQDLTYKSNLWRQLIFERDWFPLEIGGRFEGILLRSPVPSTEALAAAFNIVDAEGEVVRRVGQRVFGDPNYTPITDPFEQVESSYFKLLKLPDDVAGDPLDNWRNGNPGIAVTWEYTLRNFYDLRGAGIEPTKIDLKIETISDRGDYNDQMETRLANDDTVDWIRVFGLDRRDRNDVERPDGIPDFEDGLMFLLDLGVVRFPDETPFATDAQEVQGLTDLQLTPDGIAELEQFASDADSIFYGDIYRRNYRSGSAELQSRTTFLITGEHTSTSSRLSLNAFNIKEGSEEVSLNGGPPLIRDVDYTIDYFSGEITLTKAAAELTAQSTISVNFEVDPLFGGGRTSLHGIHLGYELGNQKSISTTWLLQSEPTTARKPRLGEEPNRTYVGNVATRLRFNPYFLTRMANWLPMVSSDQNSTINFDGEVAISVPNPNTLRQGYVDDFESADESIVIPMARETWYWASLPAEPDTLLAERRFQIDDRAFTRWFRHRPGVTRGELNPDLSEQERRDVVQALSLRMISGDPEVDPQLRQWQDNEYGGIMRGFPGQIDLSRAQYLEFWVNDFTGNVDAALREGKLHFDFGTINEDFWWQSRVNPESDELVFQLGIEDSEDVAGSGSLNSNDDTGLDGFFNDSEGTSPFAVRPGTASDPSGDDKNALLEYLASDDPILATHPYLAGEQYLYINGTEFNAQLDQEDLDLNKIFNRDDGYFSLELELSNTEDAIVDIYRDYDDPGFINDSLEKNNSWRKYRLDLRKARVVEPNPNDGTPYGRTTPDLSRISHFRIWYENPDGVEKKANPVFVFADMRFLGNRWLADGIRNTRTGQIIPTEQRGLGEDFRVGVVNNKENPEYLPPVYPDTRNNVAEKEQSLQLSYVGLREGDEIRVRQSTPGSQKLDFLLYGQHSFFWRVPYLNGIEDPAQGVLEAFYQVGTDSTSYYEIATPMAGLASMSGGWHELRIDLGELSNLRSQVAANDTLFADTEFAVPVRRGLVHDTETGQAYVATVRGRPDLRRVGHFYIGLRYPDDGDAVVGPAFDGEVLFNELRLRDVDRKVGLARRVATNVNIPGLGDVSAEYRQTDGAFRGLNQKRGTNILRRSWSLRGGTALQNLIPTFGLEIPITASMREDSQLPRYQTNTDIELIGDEQRRNEETRNSANQYSIQLRKSTPSNWRLLQYTIDRFNYSRSESYSATVSPLVQHASRRSVGQKFNYDLRVGRGHELTLPWIDWKLRYLPNQFSISSDLNYDKSGETRRTREGVLDRRVPQVSHTMRNRMQMTQNLAENIRANLSMSSDRDLRERTASAGDSLLGPTKILGKNFGHEQQFNQSLNITYNPKLPILRWFDPEIGYNTRYGESRAPGIRQREVASEDFVGVGYQVRNVGNGADLSVRGSVDAFGWIRRRWSKWRRSQTDDSGGGVITPPSERSPAEASLLPGAAESPPDSSAADSSPLPPGGEDEELAQGETEDAPAEPQQEFDPKAATASLFRPFKNLFANLRPITTTYNLNRASNFQHVNSRANLLYRFGIIVRDDNEAAGLTEAVDADVGAGPFSNKGTKRDTSINLATQSQLYESVRVDMNYRRNSVEQGGTIRQETRSRGTEIGSGLNVSQVNQWPMFRGWLSQAGIQFNYKYSNDVRNAIGNAEFPQIRHSYNPRWNGTFNNGLSASLNFQLASDKQQNNINIIENRIISTNLDLQHRFDAEGALSFLRFGRKGTGSTIDMTVNLSFRTDSGETRPKSGTGKVQSRGSRTWSVDPRFQYQFSRNVRGGLQLRYSRRTDLGRKIHDSSENPRSQSFGIFFDATLTF